MVNNTQTRLIEQTPDQFILSELYQYHLTAETNPLFITLVGGGGKTSAAFWLARKFKQWGHAVCITTTTKMYLPDADQADYILPFDAMYCNKKENEKNLKVRNEALAQDAFSFYDPTITFCFKSLLTDHLKTTRLKVSGLSEKEIKKLENDFPFTVFIIEGDGSRSLPIKAPHGHEPCIPSYSDMVIGVTGAEAINHKAIPERIHRWPAFSALTQCQPGDVIDTDVLQPLISHPLGLFKSSPRTAKQVWLINKMDKANDTQAVSQIAEEVLVNSPQLDTVWLAEMQAEAPIKKVILKEQVANATEA
ncbi:selenium cofactor biosynthesis protein YqeC [Photobacterium rosenbergii]|uniref:selenium cofactor biosynthesis protein YqeC n=1 Tax=Photobacterium rosenbergii TaxID=294936 RepID=UPI001C992FD2|nr:selenium cofactor biosynthesis protein YqeC [Photobacterium rosenbergii]MBY5945601.1 putative selenium-dependent hydroxylase accessory protein YqeC [Photobacterium rosenbergii]